MKIASIHIILMLCLSLICGCSTTKQTKEFDPNELMVFPAPPDEPRIQFLTKITSSSDIIDQRWIDEFLALTSVEKVIVKPYGIAMKNGKIYVCDTMLPGLEIIDLDLKSFEIFRPLGRGTLKKPINVALDNDGNIYVTDTGRQQVVIYTEDLKFKGTVSTDNSKPIDIAISGDTLLIADSESRNIEHWSISREERIGIFPENNSELPDSERVFLPYSVAIGQGNNFYVTDFGQSRIQRYGFDGKHIQTIGSMGRGLGQFARPKGIAIDKENNLYVVDAAFENIQLFNKDGQLLLFFGGPYQNPGNMYLPAQVTLDYNNTSYFEKYVIPGYSIKYLILVTNQFGPDKISIYGFLEPK